MNSTTIIYSCQGASVIKTISKGSKSQESTEKADNHHIGTEKNIHEQRKAKKENKT